MSRTTSVSCLYDKLRDQLNLHWIGGTKTDRTIGWPARGHGLGLVGHLSFVRRHCIEILGDAEWKYLRGLDDSRRHAALEQALSPPTTAALIIADDVRAYAAIKAVAAAHALPLLRTPLASTDLLTYLHYYLTQWLAETHVVHGVFMEVLGIGVLISGASGAGKSELALELISRGHRLVADDAPEFTRVAPDTLLGVCPEALQDYLEVRGLGLLNVRALFGNSAVKRSKYLRLIVHLQRAGNRRRVRADRLSSEGQRTLLGVRIPEITMPVAAGRNLAVLVEAATRNHLARLNGDAQERYFIERQQRLIASNVT